MSSKYARGKIAISQCDRCGMEYLLKTLKPLTIKTKITNILVCPSCWEPDQPQLQLGMYPISDPQALRNPRRDTSYVASGLNANGNPGEGSRQIQWGWNPVGGSSQFDSVLTPNDLVAKGQLGIVTVTTN
tara:strand:+ start:319 stop:708 length:390 start_codon:yes stop_codon:yes gene_type:complete